MNVGMLWFDNDPNTPFVKKVQRAVEYYRRKYGREPNLCLVHPSALKAEETEAISNGIAIRPYRFVLPGHFWIGIEENERVSHPGKSRSRSLSLAEPALAGRSPS
ncbi:MAG: hypothetical protein WHS87_05375 [Anaerolineales bacterium]